MKCPLCGNKDGLISVMKVAYPGIEYRMIHCPMCGLTFAFPMVEAPEELYTEKEWYGERWEFIRVWEIIKNGSGSILEIGCGEGFFLEKCRGKGYSLYGIDINKNALNKAREKIPEARFYTKLCIPLPEGFPEKYNIVCAFHILEHMSDPVKFLKDINSILVNKGLLFVSIPSPRRAQKILTFREWWDYPPHHLTWWNKKSIRTLLNKTGFEILSIEFEPLRFNYVKGFILGYLRNIFFKKEIIQKNEPGENKKIMLHLSKRIIKAFFMPFLNFIAALTYLSGFVLGLTGQSMFIIARVKKPIDN